MSTRQLPNALSGGAEARCQVCRSARAEIHSSAPTMSVAWLAVTLVMLLAVAAVLYGRFAG